MDLELDVLNFYPLDERLACCGQPKPEQFAPLAEDGFQAVINLATPTSSGHLSEEPGLWRALGVRFTWLPVPFGAPRPDHYLTFEAWLAARRSRRCLVHCALNFRASLFCCLYRIRREGVAPDEAWEAVREVWEPEPAWLALTRLVLGNKSPV